MLMVEKWPNEKEVSEIIGMNQSEAAVFEKIKEVIVAIRNARSENKVEVTKKVKAVIYGGKEWTENLNGNSVFIMKLKTGIEDLEIKEWGEKIPGAIFAAVGPIEIYLIVAVDSEKEKSRLEKEIANLEKFVAALNGKLSNQEFVGKAPEKVVAIEKEKLAKAEMELGKLKEQLDNLK
jgi:valyl-tRNA synthetase